MAGSEGSLPQVQRYLQPAEAVSVGVVDSDNQIQRREGFAFLKAFQEIHTQFALRDF